MKTRSTAELRNSPPDVATVQSMSPKQALGVIEGGLGEPVSKLTHAQQSAAGMVARGYSKTRIAAELNIDRVTVYRWAKIPAFQAEVNRIWQEQLASERAQLRSLAQQALIAIGEIAQDRGHPRQFDALKFIITATGLARLPYIESTDPYLPGQPDPADVTPD